MRKLVSIVALLLTIFIGLANAKDSIIVGFTMSKTGKLNAESDEQFKGLKIWEKYVNSHGGIYVKSLGKKLPVKLVYYDDESSKERVQQLYAKLILDNKADFLISPYSSELTATAAIVAEQYGKVMLAIGSASDSIFNKGYKHIFQLYTPASRYLTGAIDMLKALNPKAKKVAIIYEQTNFATDVCKAARDYAMAKGFNVVLFEGYAPGTTDFTSFINKIKALAPDAIIGGGHFADGQTLAKQLYEQKVKVDVVSLLVAPSVPEFAQIGDAALYVTAPSQWEVGVKYNESTAKKMRLPWYGPSVSWFVKEYKAMDRTGKDPGYHSAAGLAAGLVLQKAIEDAGTLDTKAVKAALERMDIMTFYGRVKFETGKFYGRQIGHEMVYLQWQKKGGKLEKVLVWPPEAREGNLISYKKKF